MHTVTLNIEDNIYNHIMFLLKSLNTKELEIVEDKVTINHTNTKEYLDFTKYSVVAFKEIKDPVLWQQKQREEWN